MTDGNCHSTWGYPKRYPPHGSRLHEPNRQARKSASWSRDVNSALEAVPAARTRPKWARARRLWGGLFAVVLVGSLAGPALATWTAPLDISRSGQDAFEPDVAVDANGNA